MSINTYVFHKSINSQYKNRFKIKWSCYTLFKSQSPISNRLKLRMIAKNKYTLPIKEISIQRIDRHSSPAHIGKLRYSIDFIAPLNIPVLASGDGIVTYVKDDSNLGGPNPSYWNYSNFITIKHNNNEYSRYDHLAKGCSKVRHGQIVKGST